MSKRINLYRQGKWLHLPMRYRYFLAQGFWPIRLRLKIAFEVQKLTELLRGLIDLKLRFRYVLILFDRN